MSKLYEIEQDFQKLQYLLEEEMIDDETFQDTFDSLKFDLSEKLQGCQIVRLQILDEEEALNKEIKRLNAKRKVLKNNAEKLKSRMLDAVKLSGEKKIKSPLFGFTLKATAGSVGIDNSNEIPDIYKTPVPDSIDKKAIMDDLKAGVIVAGASFIAGESLLIK